jgi:hypothetical protein
MQKKRQGKIMNPVSAFGSIRETLTTSYDLPLPVTICVKVLSSVHWIWWICRKKKYLEPQDIFPATLGTILDGVVKLLPNFIEKSILAIAKIILIATRIDETVHRMQVWTKAFIRLKDAFCIRFPRVIEPVWVKDSASIIVSPQTVNGCKRFFQAFIALIKRIYHCIVKLFQETFKLFMQLWDTYHAFIFNHDAIPELFVNGMHWFRKIGNNKEYILSKLSEYQFFIQKIFDTLHLNLKAADLINKAETMINVVGTVVKASDTIGEGIIGTAETIVNAISSNLLVKDLQPLGPHTPFKLKKLPHYNNHIKPKFIRA